MLTALLFIGVISILVFVHELGHFVAAKKSGMRVDEFGFGFPPKLFGIKRGETTYSINWIPFGGFVRIYGEDGDERKAPRSFGSKSFSVRMIVILAGVVMNFVFAAFLLSFGNYFGLRIGLFEPSDIAAAHDRQIQILSVADGSPAKQAGVETLDEVKGFVGADGTTVAMTSTQGVQEYVAAHVGQTTHIQIGRGGQVLDKEVALRANPPAGEGSLGISMALTGIISHPWYVAIWKGFSDAAILTYNTAYGFYFLLKGLFVERHLLADVSGPIGIATMTGQAARVGFSYLVQFVAMISINLAVLNVVPFPALDGGRALMLIIEKIKGSPINKRVEATVNAVGFFALIGLMILVTARDLSKLF